jgi:hypothetical protein
MEVSVKRIRVEILIIVIELCVVAALLLARSPGTDERAEQPEQPALPTVQALNGYDPVTGHAYLGNPISPEAWCAKLDGERDDIQGCVEELEEMKR